MTIPNVSHMSPFGIHKQKSHQLIAEIPILLYLVIKVIMIPIVYTKCQFLIKSGKMS